MKSHVFALALAVVLSLTLVACGEKKGTANDSDILGDESTQTTQNATGQTGTGGSSNGTTGNSGTTKNRALGNSGTTGSGSANRGSANRNGTTQDGIIDSNGMTGNGILDNNDTIDNRIMTSQRSFSRNTINRAFDAAGRVATWEQMLDNARVHDTDGYLLDGENSSWS